MSEIVDKETNDTKEDTLVMWETGSIVGDKPVSEDGAKPEAKTEVESQIEETNEGEDKTIEAEEPVETDEETSEPNRKDGFKRQKEKWQTKIQAKDQQIEYLMSQLQNKSTQPVQQQQLPNREPTLEEFNGNIEQFIKASNYYTAQITRSQLENQMKIEQYQKRLSEFKKSAPDFDEVLEDANDHPAGRNAQQEVLTYILEEEDGPAIQHYLGKNLEELAKINSLAPHKRYAELGKISAKIAVKKTNPNSVNRVSNAPAPVKPVTGKAPNTSTKNLYEMSANEVAEYLEQEEKKNPRLRRR